MPPAIAIAGLTKRYDAGANSVLAVNEIDLEVAEGELFGLLGPNGAGKSTTIGICTTRVMPTAGRVRVAEIDVVADPPRARAEMGVVTQFRALDRSLTCWENLYYHARYFGMGAAAARARAGELLEQFRLADRARTLPDRLSGGMAQRLQIARAVCHRPRVLFLDEPTAGLDPQSRIAVWDLVRELRAGGMTVLLTTHYIEEAERLCDRVAIIDHGRILICDTPAQLKRQAGAGVVMHLRVARAAPELAERLRALAGVSGVEPIEQGFRVFAADRDGLAPAAAAAAQDFGLEDIALAEPSLETVFIRLTGRELRE
ncbi:MAG TPA: ABC transporter ATP-binding protein [Terriglobales bacterium]|nr:ABC transporter ATP-binding protein [Terriglobales bacterium]